MEPDAFLELKTLRKLRLHFPHVPRWVVAGDALEMLCMWVEKNSDVEMKALLARTTQDLQKLEIQGPVTDAIMEDVSRFWRLSYLALMHTRVSRGAAEAVKSVEKRFDLNYHVGEAELEVTGRLDAVLRRQGEVPEGRRQAEERLERVHGPTSARPSPRFHARKDSSGWGFI